MCKIASFEALCRFAFIQPQSGPVNGPFSGSFQVNLAASSNKLLKISVYQRSLRKFLFWIALGTKRTSSISPSPAYRRWCNH